MKVKFQRIERVAGLFIVVAFAGAVAFTALAAIKKGWFQAKIDFKTKVLSAEGLRPGSQVTISGIRAGEITDVELLSAEDIVVHFNVAKEFHKQIRMDSKVQIVRPFIIGDKAIEITVGSNEAKIVEAGASLESEMSFDMLELISGKKMGPFLGTLEGLMKNVSMLATAFSDPKRTDAFVKMFDRMDPLFMNLNKMSLEVTKLTVEMNQFMPQIRKESPEVGRQIGELLTHLNQLTGTLAPAFKEVGPELPRASRRAVEALDEMVVTLKAIQRSFILSGKVKDVKDEEDERKRKPANN